MEILRLPAPAKLNLMLRIVGRRSDGYHLLQTVFQFIDRCDWLTFRLLPGEQIRLRNPLPGVAEDADLTVRAARLLQQFSGQPNLGVAIEIEKNLPMGGGLGGGSSDAASTLLGLNKLWQLGLCADTLATLGLRLGADVPVFVRGYAAWAEGVGESLTPLPALPEPWYVVLTPPCHVATGLVFSAPNLTRDHKPITITDFLAGQQENHCLPIVSEMYPAVGEALHDLGALADSPKLTGTGACVFAAFPDKAAASDAAQRLAHRWQAFVAKGANVSPLQRALGLL